MSIQIGKKMEAAYKKIKNQIITDIVKGNLKPGDRIPAESKLCEDYSVSRITASRAVNDLVAQGYLVRRRGSGSFVAGGPLQEGVANLKGFSERFRGRGLTTKVIDIKMMPAPQNVVDHFSLPDGTQMIRLKRLRLVDGKPLCLSISYLMPDVFDWVLKEDLENGSLFALLENKYGCRLGGATQSVLVGYPKCKKDYAHLMVGEGSPCLLLIMYCYLADGRPAQYDESYYVAERYAFTQYLPR